MACCNSMNLLYSFLFIFISFSWGAVDSMSGISPESEKSSRLFETELQCLLDKIISEADPAALGDRQLSLDIPNELIMNITMDNLVVTNISSTVSNLLTMTGLANPRLQANITIPLLTITADHYKLWADIFLFEIVGEGSALLYVRDVNLALDIRLRAGNPATVTSVESAISIREVETHLENLMDGGASSDMMNAILSDMVPILVDEMQDIITQQMNVLITGIVSDMLLEMTILEMIGLITNACKETEG